MKELIEDSPNNLHHNLMKRTKKVV